MDDNVWVDAHVAHSRDLVAFRIRGDSMAMGPRPIFNGDIVLVDRNDKGHHGAVVVVRLATEGYVCKVLKDDKFGWKLVSTNPSATDGTPPYIGAEDIAEVVGRVIETRRLELGRSLRE
jgi:SOS-response transcriptional repressor LexA